MLTNPGVAAGILVLGLALGYFLRRLIASRSADSVEQKLKIQSEEAKNQAQAILLEAKDKAAAALDEVKSEERNRKQQLDRLEERLLKKEEALEKQLSQLYTR